MNVLRMMTVVFDAPLFYNEIRMFRGAVIHAAGEECDLFHNHLGQGFAYRYPLVQYRIIGGKAAIVCLNEAIEQIQSLFSNGFIGRSLTIGDDDRGQLLIQSIRQNEYGLKMLEHTHSYHISRWLPLNQQNYDLWKKQNTAENRMAILNAVLVGNIISFAKGVGWQIPGRILCEIDVTSITTRLLSYKDQHLLSFSLDFSSNVFLPIGIGLGKGVSVNCGVLSRCRMDSQHD